MKRLIFAVSISCTYLYGIDLKLESLLKNINNTSDIIKLTKGEVK